MTYMTTNIDIKSRHAVWATLIWKGPTYIIVCCFIGLSLGLTPYIMKNHKEQRVKQQKFQELVSQCERDQYGESGSYDSLQCRKWANTYYPVYRY